MIAVADNPPQVADQFEVDDRLDGRRGNASPGRGYWLKLATQTVSATVQEPKYEIDVNSLEHLAAKTLELNAIGVAEVLPTSRWCSNPIPTTAHSAGSS